MSSNFGSADPRCRWGTITTHYMAGGVYDPADTPAELTRDYDERTVPSRIRESLPDVRLVAILRDPAQRALSHYRMMVMRGLERRSFDEAVDELLRPESLMRARKRPEECSSYVTWGEYGRILAGYFEIFPRDQILVACTDELEREPEALVRRVFGFIGVSEDELPDNIGTRYREGRTRRRLAWLNPDALQGAASRGRLTRGLWHALPNAARNRVDAHFAHIAYRVDLWNQRDAVPQKCDDESAVQRLRDHYRQDSEQLAGVLERGLPWQSASTT